jgi:hypothetical protein
LRRSFRLFAGKYGGRGALCISLALSAVTLAACGGGEKQDADEPSGTYEVDIVRATFPGKQYLGLHSQIRIAVANVGSETIPNLTVTLDGLDERINDPNLADPERPIWILDRPPKNSQTAFTNTFAVGPLPPDEIKPMVWNVTAVQSGTYTVRYQISAGLQGKAKAVQPDGSKANGSFLVRVTSKPLPVPDPLD